MRYGYKTWYKVTKHKNIEPSQNFTDSKKIKKYSWNKNNLLTKREYDVFKVLHREKYMPKHSFINDWVVLGYFMSVCVVFYITNTLVFDMSKIKFISTLTLFYLNFLPN